MVWILSETPKGGGAVGFFLSSFLFREAFLQEPSALFPATIRNCDRLQNRHPSYKRKRRRRDLLREHPPDTIMFTRSGRATEALISKRGAKASDWSPYRPAYYVSLRRKKKESTRKRAVYDGYICRVTLFIGWIVEFGKLPWMARPEGA